jgi:serine/threonine-protein kinase HipA
MGRRSHTRTLGLWMNGARLGTWSLAPNAPDTLQYDLDWAQSEQGRPLSLSLPFTPGNAPHRGEKVRAYFENLLPDSKDIRERLARRFKTGSTDAFELLAEIGRDCVGALEILPEGQASAGIAAVQAEPLGEAQVAQVLRSATTPHAMGWGSEDDDFRISIAGAQEKTALLLRDGQWCLPRGGTPTTHIFKLPLGLIGGMKLDMRHSVENEWLCALILKEFGLPVAACQSMQFEDTKALVVERFDRTWWTHPEGGQRLVRLPQEDMCQAMGIAPEAKYEADGGPGIDGILDLLDGSITRDHDRRELLQGATGVLDALRHRRPCQELQSVPAPRRTLPADARCMTCSRLTRCWAKASESSPPSKPEWPWRCDHKTPTGKCATSSAGTGSPWGSAMGCRPRMGARPMR